MFDSCAASSPPLLGITGEGNGLARNDRIWTISRGHRMRFYSGAVPDPCNLQGRRAANRRPARAMRQSRNPRTVKSYILIPPVERAPLRNGRSLFRSFVLRPAPVPRRHAPAAGALLAAAVARRCCSRCGIVGSRRCERCGAAGLKGTAAGAEGICVRSTIIFLYILCNPENRKFI